MQMKIWRMSRKGEGDLLGEAQLDAITFRLSYTSTMELSTMLKKAHRPGYAGLDVTVHLSRAKIEGPG